MKVINGYALRWQLTDGHVYIGRAGVYGGVGFARSKWANPFKIGRDGTRDEVIDMYRAWLLQQPDLMASLPELRGKDLVCFCAPKRCHGDVLTEMAEHL